MDLNQRPHPSSHHAVNSRAEASDVLWSDVDPQNMSAGWILTSSTGKYCYLRNNLGNYGLPENKYADIMNT